MTIILYTIAVDGRCWECAVPAGGKNYLSENGGNIQNVVIPAVRRTNPQMSGVVALALAVGEIGDDKFLEKWSAKMGGKKESDAVEVADVDAARVTRRSLGTLVDEHDEEKDIGGMDGLGDDEMMMITWKRQMHFSV